MKVLHSYRNHFFSPVLIASFVGHALFLGVTGFQFFQSPQYAVEQAPSSMEVVILQETEIKKEVEKPEQVITVKDPSPEAPVVEKKPVKEQKTVKKKIQKAVYIPPSRGAVDEAKPKEFKNPAPLYPLLARQKGWQGVVILRVFVQKNGKTGNVLIHKSSGHKLLDEAAVKAVKEWQFFPARLHGLTFSSWIKIPIRFLLEKK